MSTRVPTAENDRFAIWRLGFDGASDIVLQKETGRWVIGIAVAERLVGSIDTDEDRQAAIMDLVRKLDLELTDGSSATPDVGAFPGFGG